MSRISHHLLLVSTAAGVSMVVSTLGVGAASACLDGHDGGMHDVPVEVAVEPLPDEVAPDVVVPEVVVPDVVVPDIVVPDVEFPDVVVPEVLPLDVEIPALDPESAVSVDASPRPAEPFAPVEPFAPAEADGALARTGATTDRLVVVGAGLVMVGTAATTLGRRRRIVRPQLI